MMKKKNKNNEGSEKSTHVQENVIKGFASVSRVTCEKVC